MFAAWRRGETPVHEIYLYDTPRRRRDARRREIEAGEIVVRGDAVASDSENGVGEQHVWWVRLPTDELVGCIQGKDGVLRELSLHLCHRIWGHVSIQDLEPNVRRLSTGTNVPRAPARYIGQKRSRLEAAARARQRQRTEPPAVNPKDSVAFDVTSAPRLWVLRASLAPAVPAELLGPCAPHQSIPSGVAPAVYRDAVWDVLSAARYEIASHPQYARLLHQNPFSDLHTIDDLPGLTLYFNGLNVPIAKLLVQWFHYFFPEER